VVGSSPKTPEFIASLTVAPPVLVRLDALRQVVKKRVLGPGSFAIIRIEALTGRAIRPLLFLNAFPDHFLPERGYVPLSSLFADRVKFCLLRLAVRFGLNSVSSRKAKHRHNRQ